MDDGAKMIIGIFVALVAGYVFFSYFAPDVIRGAGGEPIVLEWDLF